MNVRLWVALVAFFAVMVVSGMVPRAQAQTPPASTPAASSGASGASAASGASSPGAEGRDGAWWDDSPWRGGDRAFHYYPDPPKPKRKPEPPKAPKPKTLAEIDNLEEFRKELERLKNVAIMNPTQENLQAYLYGNKLMMDRASLFTDQWRRVVWKTPDLDFNQHHPLANAAALEGKRMADSTRERNLQTLGKSFSLLYFMRSDCSLCKIQAPALAMFSRQYGIEVQAVSLDGVIPRDLPLPNPRVDNGISYFVSGGNGVEAVPAMYLVSHDTKQVDPLGVGVLAVEELAERIRVLRTTSLGEDYIKGRKKQ